MKPASKNLPAHLPAQKFREILLLLLFSHDFKTGGCDLDDLVMSELKVSKKYVEQAKEKASQICASLDQIDKVLTQVSTSHDFQRIQAVERSILRIAAFELLVEKKLDPPIVIAEAKRLAKKFSTPAAASFCQALLNACLKQE